MSSNESAVPDIPPVDPYTVVREVVFQGRRLADPHAIAYEHGLSWTREQQMKWEAEHVKCSACGSWTKRPQHLCRSCSTI